MTQEHSTLLDTVYQELDLVGSNLLEAAENPSEGSQYQEWRDRGDWLQLAARVNADRVFFVNDDPVLVFSSLPQESNDDDIFECYRRTWSLARPRCLFLAIGGEVRVYSLSSPPSAPGSAQEPLTALQVVTKAADVAEKLTSFHRNRLESGVAFESPPMEAKSGRADQQLLRDVRVATKALRDAGLPPSVAHTTIERAILVRYLEDREILTEEYFSRVENAYSYPTASEEDRHLRRNFGRPSRFISILSSKRRTFDLFDRLAEDFNGDLFVANSFEREIVEGHHLELLMNLLQGTVGSAQEPLFFWAYDFGVIPTSLISSMYELFYREGKSEDHTNTYYTPPELVEFVLSDVLTDSALDQAPKVCDPACGSGIFLVEAYRRIVRHEMLRESRPLSSSRLRVLLLRRIAGCDIDASAIRLAAFSLYVAYLNYQSPQDIRSAGPLPRLIGRVGADCGSAPLVVADVFDALSGEDASSPSNEASTQSQLPWSVGEFDVVVGNPPWTKYRGPRVTAEHWALRRGLPFGDRSPSQLFLWRALDLMATHGVAVLLVSAKAMLNTRSTSLEFRQQWLGSVRLEIIVNFSEVRRDFFESAMAPFMLIRFRRTTSDMGGMVVYETARSVPPGRRRSSALVRLDRQVVPQASLRARDYLWKTYSAGSIRDDALLARLELEERLFTWVADQPYGYGFQRGSGESSTHRPGEIFGNLRSLAKFDSWGPLREEWFESMSPWVKRAPTGKLFRGRRLLVRRGVTPGFGPHARLETEPFAFRHTIFAISLENLAPWQAKVILGILLSSVGRYWLYMVSGSWGTWADEVRSKDLLNLPVRLPSAPSPETQRLELAVDELSNSAFKGRLSPAKLRQLHPEMDQIDRGVAELFELTDTEQDLVADFWASQASDAALPISGTLSSGHATSVSFPRARDELDTYVTVFSVAWNRQLGDWGELTWRLLRDRQADVIAAIFEINGIGVGNVSSDQECDIDGWTTVLRRIGISWESLQGQSILRYGVIRAVSDTAIVIVKRDEKRLWTASAARRDVDATLAQVMSLRWQ